MDNINAIHKNRLCTNFFMLGIASFLITEQELLLTVLDTQLQPKCCNYNVAAKRKVFCNYITNKQAIQANDEKKNIANTKRLFES